MSNTNNAAKTGKATTTSAEAPTRQFKGRQEEPERGPEVIYGTFEGKPIVRVELFGVNAKCIPEAHRYMVLDAEDWPRIAAVSLWWGLVDDGNGNLFVAKGGRTVEALAKQAESTHARAILRRLILRADKAHQVIPLDGDPRNLMKSNLHLCPNNEVAAFRATAKAFEQGLIEHPSV